MIAPRMSAMKAAFSSGFSWYSGHIARYGSASTAKFGKKFFQSGSPPAALPMDPPNQVNCATRLIPGIAAIRGWYATGMSSVRLTRCRVISRSVLAFSMPP